MVGANHQTTNGAGQGVLRDHPLTRDRQDRLENESTKASGEPLLSAGDWLALRAICAR